MGASALPPKIARRIDGIRDDRVHGATHLAREAVSTLVMAAQVLPPGRGFHPGLREVSMLLADARPAMASIKNMVARFIQGMESSEESQDPLVLERRLLEEMEAASVETARRVAGLVFDGASIITCSYSSTVLRSFEAAATMGKGLKVLAVESRVGGVSYGERLLDDVLRLGITGEVVSDSLIHQGVKRADMALVGADKLLPDGAIVNGWPTLALACGAHGLLPLYAVCESFKRDTDPVTEEGFDLVPGALITRTVSDGLP